MIIPSDAVVFECKMASCRGVRTGTVTSAEDHDARDFGKEFEWHDCFKPGLRSSSIRLWTWRTVARSTVLPAAQLTIAKELMPSGRAAEQSAPAAGGTLSWRRALPWAPHPCSLHYAGAIVTSSSQWPRARSRQRPSPQTPPPLLRLCLWLQIPDARDRRDLFHADRSNHSGNPACRLTSTSAMPITTGRCHRFLPYRTASDYLVPRPHLYTTTQYLAMSAQPAYIVLAPRIPTQTYRRRRRPQYSSAGAFHCSRSRADVLQLYRHGSHILAAPTATTSHALDDATTPAGDHSLLQSLAADRDHLPSVLRSRSSTTRMHPTLEVRANCSALPAPTPEYFEQPPAMHDQPRSGPCPYHHRSYNERVMPTPTTSSMLR